MKKKIAILLGIVVLFSLMLMKKAESFITDENKATLSYANASMAYYYTHSDTVQLIVFSGPTMTIAKTTKNLRSGEEGSNTHPLSVVPGDTAELNLISRNTGDTYAYLITIVDTFPSDVGEPAAHKLSYVVGSETCAINGSAMANSISWCTDTLYTWNEWQTYNDTASLNIPDACTGIRWRWNKVVHDGEDNLKSWTRMRYKWYRNNN